MIQKIVKNSDIKFCVSDDSKIQDKFIIKFYTIDKSKGITRTADDVITVNDKRYIKLNWSTIKLLDNGMLNYEVNNLDSDADYDDGVYNSTFTRTTYYYLCTDSDGLVDTIEEIELRVDQNTTDITDLKSNKATITTQMGDLQNRMSSAETKSTSNEENITGLQNRISVVETKSTNNENSINTMSTDYAALVSRLEKLEANGTNKPNSLDDRVTALEKSYHSLDGRYNEAYRIMLKVDANYNYYTYSQLYSDLNDLSDRVSALEGNSTQGNNESISSLAINNDNIANRMPASETNNNSNANRALTLEDRVSALATDNDNIVNRVSALENYFQDIDGSMSSVETTIKGIVFKYPVWSCYTQISNTLNALRHRVSALERGTQGNNESMPASETNNDNIANRVLTLENRVSASETNNDNIANRVLTLENRVSALATDNDNIVNRVSALEESGNYLENVIFQLRNMAEMFITNWANDDLATWLDISNYLTWLDLKITVLETR